MKIVVMSDSHRIRKTVEMVLEKQPDADMYIHLGDGEAEMHMLSMEKPWLKEKLFYLKGNCDSGFLVDPTLDQLVLTLPYGHKIFAAHGDKYQVKFGTNRIRYEARQVNADIVLYGHTHVRECTYEDGIYIINPGSLGCPRDNMYPGFTLIDVVESGVSVNMVTLSSH